MSKRPRERNVSLGDMQHLVALRGTMAEVGLLPLLAWPCKWPPGFCGPTAVASECERSTEHTRGLEDAQVGPRVCA
jgi:hypothetical protein